MASKPDIAAIRGVLIEHLEARGITARQLSLQADLGESAVRDLLKSVAAPRIDTLFALADILKTTPEILLGRRVPVCGLIIGTGDILSVSESDGHPLTVPRPSDLLEESEAFIIADNELASAFWEGDTIFVTREHDLEPSHFLNQECLLQLAGTGALLFKKIGAGDHAKTYTLRAPGALPLLNQQLAWVAPVVHIRRRPLNGHEKLSGNNHRPI